MNNNNVIGYKLSDNVLIELFEGYSKKAYSVRCSFQEYLEVMVAPTTHLKTFFDANNIPFETNLNIGKDRQEEIALMVITDGIDK